MKETETDPEVPERDGLDEWVDELDRLIGVEEMTEEEISAAQKVQTKRKKGTDITVLIAAAIAVLLIIAALIFFRIL